MDPTTVIFTIAIAIMIVLIIAGITQSTRGKGRIPGSTARMSTRAFPEMSADTPQFEQHHHYHQHQHHSVPPAHHHHVDVTPPIHHTPPPSPPPPMHHG